MSGIRINIRDEVTPLLRRIEQGGIRARKVAGVQAAKTIRGHFARLDRQRHRGGPHHFYAMAARATTWALRGDQDVAVIVDKEGIAQRFFGGTIRPRRSKYLAIPDYDNARARDHRPREISGLHFRPTKRGGMLADRKGRPFYWLVPSVTQSPDPTVLPNPEQIMRDVGNVIDDYLERLDG